MGRSRYESTVTIVPSAGKFFFPHRKILKLFKENYSLDLLRKITYAGVHSNSSFEEAGENLRVLAEIPISTSQIQRLTIRIGKEYDEQDEQTVALWEDLPDESDSQIEVASVSVDGGRAQTREENHKPGVQNPAWRETKVGCLQVLESTVSEKDPHPRLPKAFKDQKTVKHLVEGLKGSGLKKDKDNENKDKNKKTNLKPQPKKKNTSKDYGPKVREKFVVATIDNPDAFGNMVLYKAHQKQLHTAKRKAYIGDGDIKIWTIYEDYFRPEGWTPILDFVHAVEYAFESAKLSTDNESQTWAKYMEFITHIWQGRVLTVIRRIDKTINQMNEKNSKSKIIQKKIKDLKSIRNYFSNNITRMKYPDYRKNGLPISSCHVESLIKQFNRRIKSTEKFWNKSSLKGILKLKASLLSHDDSFQQFWDNRYEHQVSTKRSYLRRAA